MAVSRALLIYCEAGRRIAMRRAVGRHGTTKMYESGLLGKKQCGNHIFIRQNVDLYKISFVDENDDTRNVSFHERCERQAVNLTYAHDLANESVLVSHSQPLEELEPPGRDVDNTLYSSYDQEKNPERAYAQFFTDERFLSERCATYSDIVI